MVLDDALAARTLVQPIDVLRDQRQAWRRIGQLDERPMAGVRFDPAHEFTPPFVPFPDAFRIAFERFGRSQVFRPELCPEAGLRVTKRGHAALGGNARARQHADVPSCAERRGCGEKGIGDDCASDYPLTPFP